jgi:parallel beta-helix repeat protein
VIERNIVYNNGKHGIILPEDCTNSVIRENIVYANKHHGIVLYLRSDQNLIENNDSFGNAAQGINVNESSGNTIRGNRVYDNIESGIGVSQTAQGNVVERNQVRGNQPWYPTTRSPSIGGLTGGIRPGAARGWSVPRCPNRRANRASCAAARRPMWRAHARETERLADEPWLPLWPPVRPAGSPILATVPRSRARPRGAGGRPERLQPGDPAVRAHSWRLAQSRPPRVLPRPHPA